MRIQLDWRFTTHQFCFEINCRGVKEVRGGGKVVLPLLAFGGIALWINYYYRRRTIISNQEEIFEVDDTKEDCLSKLPDDVLCSILGNLTVRDAARTSILSTRWKYVFASTQLRQQQPTFEFRCSDMLRIHPEVAHVQMVCCFGREFPSAFTHWFQSLSRISVESLHLSFECILGDLSQLLTFSLEVLSQSSSLEHLVLQGCVVLSSPKVRFNSLMTLTLGGVVLNSGHLEGILSSCSNLKKLTIVGCNLPYKLRLSGTVMDVVIWECVGGKEIDLHAAHLRILEYKINNNVRFFFSFVPVLENVMVWRDLRHSYSYEFGDRARDLPDQVKSLTLQFIPDQIYPSFENPTEMQMFRNLRSLILKLVSSLAIVELFDLSRLLGDFPLLQSLTFVVIKLPITRERRRNPPSPTRHTELKQVR
ncbi:hypothetical protein FXO38_34475 [Capsicum annuum]|nr:hypothetical protein FXO38_34475 [Capsicum annuum]